ncbi:MAG: DMT family transporter [Thermaerobacter sp.]|nr:DMT family transporter [Thermaerobacter sp.]
MRRSFFASLVFLTTALMGSSFTIGKIGLAFASPLLLAGVRFVLAGALMSLGVAVAKRPHPRTLSAWGGIALIGLFQTAGVMGCIFVSLRTITAAESSLITFVNPLLVVLLSSLFLAQRYRPVQWAGVLLGFAGLSVTFGFHPRLQVGTWVALTGALSWAVATLLIHGIGRRYDVWVLTAYQMLFGGAALLITSFALEVPRLLLNAASLSVLLWLAVMGSVVQFAIWFLLLQRGDPAKTSAFLFLVPLFGVFFGWLILHEKVDWHLALGGLLVLAGIFLVNWPKSPDQSIE